MDENITLYSLEGVLISIKKTVGARSIYIQGMIDDDAEYIPLPNISEKTLRRVIAYLEHLDEGNAPPEIERPLRSNDIEDVVSDWMANFIKKDIDEVQDLILAANFLDIKCLLSLACA